MKRIITSKKTKPWPATHQTLNYKHLSIVYAKPGTLPRRPEYMHTKLLRKGFENPDPRGRWMRESIVYRIFELVCPGLAPTTVRDKDTTTILVRWVRGKEEAWVTDWGYHNERLNDGQAFDIGIIQAVDSMIGNSDRHSGNVMCSYAHAHPIDHEMAFSNTYETPLKVRGWRRASLVDEKRERKGFEYALKCIAARPRDFARLLTIGVHSRGKTHVRYTAKQVTTWVVKSLDSMNDFS